MIKFKVYYAARIYLIFDLQNYLNDFGHNKEEEEQINNLIERLFTETSLEMTFSEAEVKLLINALNHALNNRPVLSKHMEP